MKGKHIFKLGVLSTILSFCWWSPPWLRRGRE